MSHRNSKQLSAEMNVPLMRRVAVTLVATNPDAFGGLILDARGDVVTLTGRLADEAARRSALALVRGTTGVKEVVDRITIARSRADAPIACGSIAASWSHDRSSPRLTRSTKALLLMVIVSMISPAVLAHITDNAHPVKANHPRLPVVPVAGMLIFQGQPAAGARLVFHPLNNTAGKAHRAIGVVASDGRFELGTFGPADGAAPGEYAVTVEWPRPQIDESKDAAEELADDGLDPDRAPLRFRRFDTTPLRVEITPMADAAQVRLQPIHIADYPDPANRVL